ncbi:MAG: dTMP kinase [Desulfotignum sp.]|nr:dTMP kinase [Desulfotignum sp.]MCF8139343.1 dTMP kinase [Desulfotignum sp.]
MTTGRFVVFEGLDGSGKTTQMARLQKRLTRMGIDAVATCEPTEGPVGALIRQMLAGRIITDPRTLAALFAADRTDHLVTPDTGVTALMEKGRMVLCDRYYFSSYAYHATDMDLEWVITLNAVNAQILKPDLTLFIDVAPNTCLERIRAGRTHLDLFEKIDILTRVRDNYFAAFERLKDQETVKVVDGNASEDEVEQAIWHQISHMLPSG